MPERRFEVNTDPALNEGDFAELAAVGQGRRSDDRVRTKVVKMPCRLCPQQQSPSQPRWWPCISVDGEGSGRTAGEDAGDPPRLLVGYYLSEM